MNNLFGIALVVDDISKGCNLAFRYPAPPSTSDDVTSFHKLSSHLIAKLFRPKNALCNQSFELVIDDLRFISHPIIVTPRSSINSIALSANSFSNGNNPMTSFYSSTNHNSISNSPIKKEKKKRETTMFNVIFALEDFRTQHHYDPIQAENAKKRWKRSLEAYRKVAAQLANGLLHEELRCGYLTTEVRDLLYIRDELIQQERASGNNHNLTGVVNSTTGNTSNAGSNVGGTHRSDGEHTPNAATAVDFQTFIDVSLGKNTLANDLKAVFHGLDEFGTVHVVLNRWVKLSLTLSDSIPLQLQNLRPYQTLLLIKSEEKIIDALPHDASPQLRTLIEAANPLKSFQELELETSLPLHQLFRLATHLVYWGYGRIIDTITMHNTCQVTPHANLSSQSALAHKFRRKFAPNELCEVLATFSASRRIGEYMKNLSGPKKVEYVHMLIWLMQQNFVTQLHRYVYLMIPADDAKQQYSNVDESDKSTTLALKNQEDNISTTSKSGITLSNPTLDVGISDHERAYLEKIATKNPVFSLFKRLCVYFHGQYHLEEIMWRENVSRSDLRAVLRKYEDLIVCCMHE